MKFKILFTLLAISLFGTVFSESPASNLEFVTFLQELFSPRNKLLRISSECPEDVDFTSLDLEEETTFNVAQTAAEIGVQFGANTYPVVLDPRQKTSLYAEISVPIKKITKRMGEHFEKGELLIQLEDQVSYGYYKKTVAILEKAKAKLEATQQLYDDQLASLFELKEAEAALAEAEAEFISAKKHLDSSQIFAPYSGVVDTVYVEEFELSQSSKQLIKVLDDEVLVAKLLIPSTSLPSISIGEAISLVISETGDVVNAKITRIGGMIDPSSSTIRIEAEIDNHERRYKPGMTGLAKVPNYG